MIKKISIVGMGALGLLYGSHISKHGDAGSLSFVMDDERCKKHQGEHFLCNGEDMVFNIVAAEKAKPADLVIVAVKYNALGSALDTMKNCVGDNTVIISVMNGITSEEIISARYGSEKIVHTVAQGMDAMKFGSKLTYSQMGNLCIGIVDEANRDNLNLLTSYFDSIKMPYIKEKDIMHRMWSKFMLNVGINQVCMVFETDYGGVLKSQEALSAVLSAMHEVMALANSCGINITESDVDYYMDIIRTLLPEGVPSMRQDAIQKRYSEVEMFSGTVIRMAKQKNIPVPTNQFLYDKIKEIEASY